MKQTEVKRIKERIRELDQPEYIVYESSYGTIKLSKGVEYITTELMITWLINLIIKAQNDEQVKKHRIQYWEMYKFKNKTGLMVYCTNGSRSLVFSEIVYVSELACISIEMWLIDGFLTYNPQSVPD